MVVGANVFVINVDFVDATAKGEGLKIYIKWEIIMNAHAVWNKCANKLRIRITYAVAYF